MIDNPEVSNKEKVMNGTVYYGVEGIAVFVFGDKAETIVETFIFYIHEQTHEWTCLTWESIGVQCIQPANGKAFDHSIDNPLPRKELSIN